MQAFPFTMLHRHFTVAYRALDSKWGTPVDLDTSDEGLPCLPAIVEKATTTFSSEEYLRKLRRQKPYLRNEDPILYRRKKMKDSFSNISRNASESDLGGSVATLDTAFENHRTLTSADELVLELKDLVEQLKEPLEECLEDVETISEEMVLEKKKEQIERVFKKMKDSTFSFIHLKSKRKAL